MYSASVTQDVCLNWRKEIEKSVTQRAYDHLRRDACPIRDKDFLNVSFIRSSGVFNIDLTFGESLKGVGVG